MSNIILQIDSVGGEVLVLRGRGEALEGRSLKGRDLLQQSASKHYAGRKKDAPGRLSMMLLKGCPRCHGDLHVNTDMYGAYVKCLQCGYMKDLEGKSRVPLSPSAKADKRAA